MLQYPSFSTPSSEPRAYGQERTLGQDKVTDFDLAYLVRLLFRRRWTILGVLGAFLLLGIITYIAIPARYTSGALILIDPKRTDIFRQDSLLTAPNFDTALVESQANILRSEGLLREVIKKLSLDEDIEFIGDPTNLIPTINRGIMSALSIFGVEMKPDTPEARIRRALAYMNERLEVARQGLSYVIAVNFTALEAAKAAKVANAIADAYIADQLNARFQVTERAKEWLLERTRILQAQKARAEQALLDFKTKNNMLDSNGKPLNDQQLGELTSQLVLARAQTSQARARLDQINSVIANDAVDGSVGDALANEVITRLRQQYLEVKKTEAEFSSRYGASHTATINLRNQMRELQSSIRDELKRIASSWKSDYEIAKARQDSIERSIEAMAKDATATRQSQIAAHDLETEAASYRTLFDTFTQRQMQALEQQSFPITDARVVSTATPPLRPSFPKLSLVLALSIAAGGALGVFSALAREFFDRTVRLPEQAEGIVGAECIGVLPLVQPKKSRWQRLYRNRQAFPIRRQTNVASATVDQPFSQFAETIRTIKVSAEQQSNQGHPMRVMGVSSALANEGKTTVAINVGRSLAGAGHRVLLIDGDLRNPSIGPELGLHGKTGLLDVLTGTSTLDQTLVRDPLTGMDILLNASGSLDLPPSEYLASAAMKQLLDRARNQYEYVIVDLPPIIPVVDVRACSRLMDGVILVVEWGVTSEFVLERAAAGVDKLFCCVLNKADIGSIQRYQGYEYHQSTSKYYRDYSKA
jgi:succinoglycan biosynthesis transport protein ExoP